MRRPFATELSRMITSSLGRFLAILAISGLGVGFFAGLSMVGTDMRGAADMLFDGTALYDIRLISTLGFSSEQVDAVKGVDGVQEAVGEYACDAMCKLSGDSYAMRVMSFDTQAARESAASDDLMSVRANDDYLNRLILAEGSWPQADNECVLSADRVMGTPIKPGDHVEVLYGTGNLDDVLDVREFTVTGTVHASSFVSSSSLGTTKLGGGTIQQFMYVPRTTFADDLPFTEVYVAVSGARDLVSGSDAYKARVEEVSEGLSSLGLADLRYDEVVKKATDEVDKNQREYDDERQKVEDELDKARSQLDSSAAQLDDAQAQLDAARNAYESGAAAYEDSAAQATARLDEAERALGAARANWVRQRSLLESQLDEVRGQIGSLEDQRDSLTQAVSDLTQAASELQARIDALPATGYDEQRAALEGELAAVNTKLSSAHAGLDQVNGGIVAAKEGARELEEGIATGDASIAAAAAELEAQRGQAQEQLDAAKAELDQAASQIESGTSELVRGRSQLASGRSEYDSSAADASNKLADAASQLEAARGDIADIKHPNIYILDRTKNPGAASYQSDSERIDNIARVFPLIFFMVAALVSLTTMTRMVEDERVNIGTHKALGFSRAFVTMRYLCYAAIACVLGSAVGIGVLSQALPFTVMKAYAIIYSVPIPPLPIGIDILIAALSVCVGLVVTLGATFLAASASLAETPAALMLPRAPRPGKRILLERIGPIWSRLSFSRKVTLRNLFRFKRRLLMTTVGIAGCCALLLTGLGLEDSINDIITYQFEGQNPITRYNVEATCSPSASQETWDLMDSTLARAGADNRARMQLSNMKAMAEGSSDENALIVMVPQNASDLTKQVDLRERVSKREIPFDSNSVVLTEKLANKLGATVGSTIRLYEQDDIGNATGEGHALTVTGIAENYIFHYAYVGPDAWAAAMGTSVEPTAVMGHIDQTDEARATCAALVDNDNVETVIFNTETIDTYRKSLRSVNMIVTVLVVAAATLAFIVLYNLTNINIVERTREIASLKVLGFLPREVISYIFREVAMLVIMGAAAGLVLGVVLEGFVVLSSEVDLVMFGRDIHLLSFVIAFVVTLAFAAVVMLVMVPKLRRIDMVESLKSVD